MLAQATYSRITTDSDANTRKLLKSFPILTQQWASISPFRDSILTGSRTLLEGMHSESLLLGALAAITLLEDTSPSKLCAEYLRARIVATCSMVTSDDPSKMVSQRLRDLIRFVLVSIREVDSVFGPEVLSGNDSSSASSKIDAFIAGIGDSNSLTGDLNRLSTSHFLVQTMPAYVREFVPAVTSDMPVLPLADLQAMTTDWLKELVEKVVPGVSKILASIGGISELIQIRSDVFELLQTECADVTESGNWAKVCDRVLGAPADLWTRLFLSPFSARSQSIITGMFRESNAALTRAIESSMADLSDPTMHLSDKITHASKDGRSDTQESLTIALEYDAGLTSMYSLVLKVIGVDECNSDNGYVLDKFGDAIETRRFVQVACEVSVSELVKTLSGMQRSIVTENDNNQTDAGRAAVKQVLFLGRTCRTIVERATTLDRLMLLPSRAGNSLHIDARSTGRHRLRQQPSEHDNRLAALKDSLQQVCIDCHMIWGSRLAARRALIFRNMLFDCTWYQVPAARRVWKSHAVNEDVGSENAGAAETLVQIPAQPSCFVMKVLTELCVEINHAGGHTIERSVLVSVVHRLYQGVLAAYRELLASAECGALAPKLISQAGALQLLFDLYFVEDLLHGPEVGPTADAALIAETRAVVGSLESKIDPFDLDVFRPLVHENRGKANQRCAVLLGFISLLHPSQATARVPLSGSENHNTVAMADISPRFPLLPIGISLKSNSSSASLY